jgi:hypothetical protein
LLSFVKSKFDEGRRNMKLTVLEREGWGSVVYNRDFENGRGGVLEWNFSNRIGLCGHYDTVNRNCATKQH